jgi:hypothetical protein
MKETVAGINRYGIYKIVEYTLNIKELRWAVIVDARLNAGQQE